jgi:hypothetical protein
MFQTTNHIRLNPPRVEGTRFRFRWWLQILNRFFPKANLKILGHTHMLEKKVCWQWLRRENQENLAAQDSACGTSSVSSITGTTLFLRTGRLTRGCSSQWRCHHCSSLLNAMQRSENSTLDHQLKCWWFLTRLTNLFEGGKTANLETFQLPVFPASFAIGSTRLCLPGRSAKPGKSLSPPSQMMRLVIFRADHHLIHSNPIPPIFNTPSQRYVKSTKIP